MPNRDGSPTHAEAAYILAQQRVALANQYQAMRNSGHGAIAWSPSQRRWGSAINYSSQAEAELVALSKVGTSDAVVMVTGQHVFLALVIDSGGGPEASGGWSGRKASAAQKMALQYLKQRHGKTGKLEVLTPTGNIR